MNAGLWLELGVFLGVLIALVKPLGWYMARVYRGEPCGADQVLSPIARLIYRFCGVRPEEEMTWSQYAVACLLFNALGVLTVYGLQRTQGWLPLNPQQFPNTMPDLAFNTATSFASNTNWQAYSGESSLSYLTQMLGL